MAVVTPSILQAATGNTFPGGTAYVFQYDVNNPRPERRDDLMKIWFPNEAAPFLDAATRTVNVAQVYQSATPRYVVEYGQDPTDEDLYGRVVRETVGDPPTAWAGPTSTCTRTQDLPASTSSIRPIRIVFRCVLTDRNDNQTIYDFNAAQMPVRVEVIRSRGEDRHPLAGHLPQLRHLDAVQPATTSRCLQILPEGNSIAFTLRGRQRAGPADFYNRRAGLLLSRTAYPGNPFSAGPCRIASPPTVPASNGQSELTERFFYEPIFNQPCASIERRGNPIDAAGRVTSRRRTSARPDRRRPQPLRHDHLLRLPEGRPGHDHRRSRPCRRHWASPARRSRR